MDPAFMRKAPPPTVDIGHVSGSPQRGFHHRRAHSDTTFRLSNYDDLLRFDPFDIDFSNFPSPFPDIPNDDAVVAAPGAPMAVDSSSEESNGQNSGPSRPVGPPVGHLRSLSMDSGFFDGMGLIGVDGGGGAGAGENFGGKDVAGEKPVVHHRQNISMDGSTNVSIEAEPSVGNDAVKKAMAPDKLAELALVDPKRAKRILANRQSAARSKERRNRYTNELEKKVQTLQTESTNLSAKLTMLERDNTGMSAENKELKLRLEAMQQQAKLRDALNESLREELRRLKTEHSQTAALKSNNFAGLLSQFASQLALHQLANTPSQQAQQEPQLDMHPTCSDQPFNGQPDCDFSYFNPQN